MATKFFPLLSACVCAGALEAAALSVDVKAYDFNTLVASGTGTGTAVLSIDGTQVASKTVSGAYALEATGLTPGHVYRYQVTIGEDSTSGDFVMGNGTGRLFGADATSGASVLTAVTADETAPYVAPTVTDSQYVLQASSNKFDLASSPAGKIVRIDSTMTFTGGADELDETLEALGAFTLAQTNELTDACSWMGLTGDDPKWVELTAAGITPATGTWFSRMEFDFNSTPARVRYLIGTDAASLAVLKDASGAEWFSVALQSATSVSSVAYEGTGSFAKMEGSSFTTSVAQVGETEYGTIAGALTANPSGSVTLLTNTRPACDAGLSGQSWTINENGQSFEPVDVTGYTHTYAYASGEFAVMPFVTTVTVAGVRGPFGCDYTNGVLNVTVGNAQIQSGAPVTLEVAVKDASGNTVASETYSGITGDTQKALTFPAADQTLATKGEYTYEITAKKGDETLATDAGSFRVGNLGAWFSASSANWANGGAWSTNGEPVTVTGEKLALAGQTWDFTPVEPGVSNAFVRVDTVIEIDGPIDNDDLPTTAGVQGMIALAETSAEDETPVWKAFNGESWIALTGGATAAGTYTVRAEFDYTRSPRAIRYSVAPAGSAFVVLMNGSDEWISNGVATATTLAKASAYGVGNLVSLTGDNLDAFVAEANGVGYESLAAALAAGGSVKLLWNCSWTPGRVGFWTIDANGKTLSIYGADGWDTDYSNGILQASDTEVAAIGETRYYFLTKAFAAVAADGTTVTLLTNVVQGLDVALANSADLDLAGWYLSGAGTFAPADDKALTVTNSTGEVGGFGLAIKENDDVVVKGGKWVANSVGTLGDDYKFFGLAVTTTVDSVDYAFEAVHTTVEPTEAKVYPIAQSNETVEVITDAVVSNSFVDTYIKGGKTMTDTEVAVALNSTNGVANGLPPIQSYVLGLTPTDANSKPVVSTAQAVEANTVSLSLGDSVKVNPSAGVKVTYSLSTADNPNFTGAAETDKQDSSSFSAAVPATGGKVKYYRINVNFGK